MQTQAIKKPTHPTCRRGHKLTPKNIYRDSEGYPQCRACRNLAVKRYRKNKRKGGRK